jgi:hypothetical protein
MPRQKKPAPKKTTTKRPAIRDEAKKTTSMPAPRTTSSSIKLVVKSAQLLISRWQFYLGLAAVLGLLNILLVHNLFVDINDLRGQIEKSVGGNEVLADAGTYVLLLANKTGADGVAGVYQYLLLILGSLATIWSLRQFMSDNPPVTLRVRDAFYEGLYPFATFLLVLVVLVLELMPMAIGGSLYNLVLSGGLIVNVFEHVIWLALFLGLTIVSLWLVARSLFAPYIVTLPAMTPVSALRRSGQISKGHRLNIVRKVLFLLCFILVCSALLLMPAILIYAPIAPILLFVASMIGLLFVHAYLYTFYREFVA